jgi:hypothetical protein
MGKQVHDPQTRQALLREAAERQVSVCPHCLEFVPLPEEISVPTINVRRGRLSALGYSVEIDDSGLFSHLTVSTPAGMLWSRAEPGQLLTLKGRLYLFAALPVYAALLTAVTLPVRGLVPIVPVSFLLGLSLILWWFLRIEPGGPAHIRVLQHAWHELVPALLLEGTPVDGIRFAAGLARLCEERRYFSVPVDLLRALEAKVEDLLADEQPATALLAALRRFTIAGMIADQGRSGIKPDPIALLVEPLAKCFQGQSLFTFAQNLLSPSWLTSLGHPDVARLRLLLCRAAFDAGFEVTNILDACRNSPALDALINTKDLPYLAMLRLLHGLRGQAPWAQIGGARTAFELTMDPQQAGALVEFPQLLLLHTDLTIELFRQGTPQPARIALCAGGIRLGDKLIASIPARIEMRAAATRGVHELRWDDLSFELTADPTALTLRLEKWVRLYLQSFRPRTNEALHWQPSSASSASQSKQLVECPQCHCKVFPRQGDFALPLEMGRLVGFGGEAG